MAAARASRSRGWRRPAHLDRITGHAGPFLAKDVRLIADVAAVPADAVREPRHDDAGHGVGERGATLLAAADAALTLMNVARA